MSLDKTILDVGPTFDINNRKKGTAYVNPRGSVDEYNQPPETAGVIIFRPETGLRSGVLYVSVETSPGILDWKRVQPLVYFLDSSTGQPWDPNAGFIYSYTR